MDPAKQQQIMGYFLEEARDHLNTIEGGLLNLQSLLSDAEMVNEVFRAAHSIKGGAAMLGISSVQRTAHNLEDYFKILRDHPNIEPDQHLQTLFLQSFDKLQELIDQLQGPHGIPPEVAESVMADAEPIFSQLKAHLEFLVSGKTAPPAKASKPGEETKAMALVFQSDIPLLLRDMLQLFKQPDRPTSRQSLQALCDRLYQAGEQFDLKHWCEVIKAVRAAIGNPNNSYRALAPVAIKEIKQSQELVLARRAADITVSPQLKQLLPPEPVVTPTPADDDVSTIFGTIVEEDAALRQWKEFGDRIGWRANGMWLTTAKVNFSEAAPRGHLPAPLWLSAWDKPKDSNAEEFRQQLAALMAKLAECGVK